MALATRTKIALHYCSCVLCRSQFQNMDQKP